MSSTSRKILFLLFGVLVVVFLVHQTHGLSHFGNFSGAKLLDALKNANFYFLALAVLLIYVCYGIRALRWQVFQKNLGSSDLLTIFRMTVAGFSAVLFLGRAGEPARPLLIAREEKLPVADMFGIYVLERLFDATSTLVVASVALILFKGRFGDTRSKGFLLLFGLIGAIGALVYLRLRGTSWIEARLAGWIGAQGWRAVVARALLGVARGMQTIRTWTDLWLSIFYSALHWYLIGVTYYLVMHSFRGQLNALNVGDAMLVMVSSAIGSIIQLPAVGGGAQFAAAVVLTKIFDVPQEAATLAALMLWVITSASCIIVGIPLLIREGFSLGQLREMSDEERKEEAGVLPAGSTQATLDELGRELPATRQGDHRN
jgi:uncharacterized protein (TIRG00374 family)